MRLLVIGTVSLFLCCCNNSPSKEGEQRTDSTAKSDTLPRRPPPPEKPDTLFTAFGNEPFWALYVIRDQKLIFHPADGPDVEVPWVNPVNLDSQSQRYTSAGDSAAIELNIIKKECSDGMSDLVHRFETTVKVNAITYHGCGRE